MPATLRRPELDGKGPSRVPFRLRRRARAKPPRAAARSRARWPTPTVPRPIRRCAGRGRRDPPQAPRAEPRGRGAATAVLGRADHRHVLGQRCCPTSTTRCSINSIGATRSRAPLGRVPGLGPQGARRAGASSGRGRRGADLHAPGGLRLQGCRRGNTIVLFDEGGSRAPASSCRARPRKAACASPTSCATSTSPSATCWACRW